MFPSFLGGHHRYLHDLQVFLDMALKKLENELLHGWIQHLERRGLRKELVFQNVLNGIVQDARLDAGELPLENQRVLILWPVGLLHVRGNPQVLFRVFAIGFVEVGGHLIELGHI